MNTRQIEYFLAVANELNFTKAAEKMYVSQTAVTQQIKALEDAIGAQLFARTKKKVALTSAGEAFYLEAPGILEHIEAVFQHTKDAATGMTGTLEIGFSADAKATAFPDRILDFHHHYPNIRLHFSSGNPSDLAARLRNRELDLIVTPIFDDSYLKGISYKVYQRSPLVVVVPIDHRLSHKRRIYRKDLVNEKLILACSPDSKVGEDKVILEPFIKKGYQLDIVDKIEDIETILLMISLHMGISILPKYVADANQGDKRVIAIPFEKESITIENALAWNTDHTSATVQRLISFITEDV